MSQVQMLLSESKLEHAISSLVNTVEAFDLPSTISPGPCFFPPDLIMFGGLSKMDKKFGSSAGCLRWIAVLDICLHSGHRWNIDRCGRRHAALEAILRTCETVE